MIISGKDKFNNLVTAHNFLYGASNGTQWMIECRVLQTELISCITHVKF